jgi:glycosyltransferase involved in cell wall biosynthesis
MPSAVSIVTVSYDTFFFVRLFVEKVREFVGERDYEVIVVDRGSRDGTREWLTGQRDVRMLTTGKQRRGHGHGEAAEAGAREATFNRIVLLDSDAHPTSKDWLELTVDKLDVENRLAGAKFHGLHNGNPFGWYIHPHFMAFHRADIGSDIVLRKLRPAFDTGEEATVRMLGAGRGVIGYPLEFYREFAVGHPHFPTVCAGVFHAWYGTRLTKESGLVTRETDGAVNRKKYLEPLQARLREAYRLDY